jgi:hypothetical protein
VQPAIEVHQIRVRVRSKIGIQARKEIAAVTGIAFNAGYLKHSRQCFPYVREIPHADGIANEQDLAVFGHSRSFLFVTCNIN